MSKYLSYPCALCHTVYARVIINSNRDYIIPSDICVVIRSSKNYNNTTQKYF